MMNNLIETWLRAQHIDVASDEYDEVGWAVDELFNLAYSDPYKLLNIIVDILKQDSSEKTLGALGAGVIEDLLVHHGDECIAEIARLAGENKSFNKMLQFTYVDFEDVSINVYETIQSIKYIDSNN